MVSGSDILRPSLLPQPVLRLPDGAAGDHADYSSGGDAANRAFHGVGAAEDQVQDSWIRVEAVLTEPEPVQHEGTRSHRKRIRNLGLVAKDLLLLLIS